MKRTVIVFAAGLLSAACTAPPAAPDETPAPAEAPAAPEIATTSSLSTAEERGTDAQYLGSPSPKVP